MKNILKRSLSILLAITIIFGSACIGIEQVDFNGLFAVEAEAASSGTCGSNLTWVFDDTGVLTISGTGKMFDYSSSTTPWHQFASDVKSIVIESGVTSIGCDAFTKCKKITSVTIPGTVKSIGDWAFFTCSNLTSLTIPYGVESIGSRAFASCSGFSSLTIPASVKTIDTMAFYGCSKLEDITLPDSLTSIGNDAFASTGYYKNMDNWTNGVLYINDYLIDAKYLLSESYTVKNGTKGIGAYAFEDCTTLKSITFPNDLVQINTFAFKNCTGLTSVVFPDKVKNIDSSAFKNCTSIITLSFGKNISSIGMMAFYDCTSLTEVHIKDIAQWCNVEFSSSSNPLETAKNLYLNDTLVTSLVIPKGVKSVSDYAFKNCLSLTKVSFSDTVTNIGLFAFQNCENITSVSFGKNLDSIGVSAFFNCNKLKSVVIPEGTTKIGGSAFERCSGFSSVTIPKSVTSIGSKAFGYISSTEKINNFKILGVKGSTAETYAKENGFIFSILVVKPGIVKLGSVSNTSTGIKITWSKVKGADNYEVYRKIGSGKWTKIATVKGTVSSYTDKKAKTGTTYKYTVKAKNEAGASKYNTTGLTIKCLAEPVLKTPTSAKKGITLKWSKVTGAQGYAVYRKSGNGNFKKLTTVKGATKVSYVDKSAKKGTKYTYKLKAYSGKTYSAYSNAKTIKDKY